MRCQVLPSRVCETECARKGRPPKGHKGVKEGLEERQVHSEHGQRSSGNLGMK